MELQRSALRVTVPTLNQHGQNRSILFGQSGMKNDPQQQLAQAIRQSLPSTAITEKQLLAAIQKGQELPLPKGYRYAYGILQNGKLETRSPELQTLVAPLLAKHSSLPGAQPILLKIQTPASNLALQRFTDEVLKKDFAHEYKNEKTGITHNNVILSDLFEKLISGTTTEGLSHPVATELKHYLDGQKPEFQDLRELYRIEAPGSPELTKALNQNNVARQKLIGLELAQKVYADSQEVEWHSIALSLGLGVLGEPTINAIFKDGGPVASAVRTGLMSGIDITGNILSVMGVVNENLKARNKKLSFETVFGPKEKRQGFKHLFKMPGEAGPDIKQGIKAGVQGGLIGVLFNIPAGTILSMPSASMPARSMIGGIGADGSAVAIPPVIKGAKESFEKSIEALEEKGFIKVPKEIAANPAKKKKYIEKMALKELNGRIGMASSIKATHPLPLTSTGTIILAAEKFGLPREYVQTAYMALAPVMHNFLRLVYTGVEKYWTIPQRMKTLKALVYQSKDQPFDEKQQKKMDSAFLSNSDKWLSQGLCQMGSVVTVGSVLLLAEVLVFAHALQRDKDLKKSGSQPPKEQPPVAKPPVPQASQNPLPPLAPAGNFFSYPAIQYYHPGYPNWGGNRPPIAYPWPAFQAPVMATGYNLRMNSAYYAPLFPINAPSAMPGQGIYTAQPHSINLNRYGNSFVSTS